MFAGYCEAEKTPCKMCPFQKCALQYEMWTKVGSPSSRYCQRGAGTVMAQKAAWNSGETASPCVFPAL